MLLNPLAIIAGLLMASSVVVATGTVLAYGRSAGKRRSLAYVLRIGAIRSADPTMATPAEASALAASWHWLSRHCALPSNEAQLRRHLGWAGKASTADLDRVLGHKLVYALAGLALGVFAGMRWGVIGWLALVPVTLVAYVIPDVLVYNAGLKRTQEILLTLPDALDLLHLCVESGLSLQAALSRVATSQQGPVASEFGRVLKEMQLGVSRADAFAALGERTSQPDLQRFVAAVQQVDRLGIPVATVLREQSSEMRAKRHARAREQAQKVPVKILAPLMLCFLPGLFIIILGPAIVNAAAFFLR